MSERRLAVLLSFSGAGGVERMVLNLLPWFVEQGVRVDLLAIRAHAAPPNSIPLNVRLIDLRADHNVTAVPAIVQYLRGYDARRRRTAASDLPPLVMLAAKDRAIRAAVRARKRAGTDIRIVGRLGTNLSEALAHKHPVQRWLRCLPLRRAYARVDHIVAVSEGVAQDTVHLTGVPPERISVIRNPVITPRMLELAQAPAPEEFAAGDAPVILGAGRLTEQKDFATLLRAFALVRGRRPARLIILGEGGKRAALTTLANELGMSGVVSMPGHVDNPYAYMAHANLFVLSSRWEGSPNVLTEALALGTPVVATDCPSGPREILRGGAVAPLVPVGDVQALAQAMLAALDRPSPPELLRAAASEYTQAASGQRYLEVLGLT
jgi:glycosyltransferase involved in cell wall biosynthesis